MPLRSAHFTLPKRNDRLEACATTDAAHIALRTPRERGEHVAKVQAALAVLVANANLGDELGRMEYGPLTAAAVLRYKQTHKPPIVNFSYQSQADNIVGRMTIQALDEDMLKRPPATPSVTPPAPAPAPIPLPVPKDWFVTSLSLSTFSAIVAFGFTAATGTIKFEKPNGDAVTLPIGLFGPSVGLSFVPDFGKLLSKVPGVANFLSRFPALKQFIMPGAVPLLSNDLLKFVISTRNPIARLFFDNPVLRAQIQKVITGLSGGEQDWWSAAIGEAFGRGGRELKKADFSGPCICFSVGGTVGPGNFGLFALFFGLDRDALGLVGSNPMVLLDLTQLEAHAKGFAIISSASVSASIPGLGAGATVFFGEIV